MQNSNIRWPDWRYHAGEKRPTWQKIPRGIYWGIRSGLQPFEAFNELELREHADMLNPKYKLSKLENKIRTITGIIEVPLITIGTALLFFKIGNYIIDKI